MKDDITELFAIIYYIDWRHGGKVLLLPHSKKVHGLNPSWASSPFWLKFACVVWNHPPLL